jgi:hypothetical protein
MTTITGDEETNMLALTFKNQASSKLRQRLLQDNGGKSAPAHLWAMYALLTAEVAGQNYLAAAVHGKMLRNLIQPDQGPSDRAMPDRFRMAVMLQDSNRASMSLSRPSFDLDRWATDYLPGTIFDDLGTTEGPSLVPRPNHPLNSGIKSRELRLIFQQSRDWLYALGMLFARPQLFNITNRIISFGSVRIMLLQGHLINHYLDATQMLTSTRKLSDFSRLYLQERALICLAGVCWLRRVGNESLGAGSKLARAGSHVYDASPIILRHLEKLLVASKHVAVSSGPDAQPRLWVLYIGAIAEQAPSSRVDPLFAYHTTEFAELAGRMGLNTWEQVEDVLKGFLYVERVGPKARFWFEELRDVTTAEIRA